MNNNTLIRVFGLYAVVVVGAGLGILFNYGGDKVQAFGLLTGLVLLFVPVLLGFKQSADAAERATEAKEAASAAKAEAAAGTAQSQQNTKTLAVMAPQVQQAVIKSTEAASSASQAIDAVADNTAVTLETQQTGEKTHLAVNGRMDDLIAKVEQQGRTLAELAGERGRTEGIAEGRAQITAEQATPPPEAHE